MSPSEFIPDSFGPPATKRGVVGVLTLENKLLVIRRSLKVRAPGKYCFPGGTVEEGETLGDALVREMHEELGMTVKPIEELWTATTEFGTHLSWWQIEAEDPHRIVANENEVGWWGWLTIDEILGLDELLPGNRRFFEAYFSGDFRLPIRD